MNRIKFGLHSRLPVRIETGLLEGELVRVEFVVGGVSSSMKISLETNTLLVEGR